MSTNTLLTFVSTISVYIKSDSNILNINLDELNKIIQREEAHNKQTLYDEIKQANKKITQITNKIIKEFDKIKIKSDKLK